MIKKEGEIFIKKRIWNENKSYDFSPLINPLYLWVSIFFAFFAMWRFQDWRVSVLSVMFVMSFYLLFNNIPTYKVVYVKVRKSSKGINSSEYPLCPKHSGKQDSQISHNTPKYKRLIKNVYYTKSL